MGISTERKPNCMAFPEVRSKQFDYSKMSILGSLSPKKQTLLPDCVITVIDLGSSDFPSLHVILCHLGYGAFCKPTGIDGASFEPTCINIASFEPPGIDGPPSSPLVLMGSFERSCIVGASF